LACRWAGLINKDIVENMRLFAKRPKSRPSSYRYPSISSHAILESMKNNDRLNSG
jgi:hypothetical protein